MCDTITILLKCLVRWHGKCFTTTGGPRKEGDVESYMKYLYDYDPFCGSAFEDQDRYELRTNSKTKFDNYIINYYY